MRNTKRILALSLATFMMSAALSACSGGKTNEESSQPGAESAAPAVSAEPVMGGELTVGIAQDLDDTLDPQKMVSAGTREVLFNVYEGLVKPDTKGNMVPAVASEYKISDTGDTFTFTLRDGIKFHNGNAVTVKDVVYSIKRAAGFDTGTPLIDGFDAVKSVEAPDDSTVVITLKEPNIEFLALLTAAIIPDGSNPAEDNIGTGPFRLVSRTPQESIILERFGDYWGTPPYVDKVTYKIIDNAEALVMSLRSGAIDLVAHLTSAQVNELGEGFTIKEGTMNLVQAVYLNNAAAPFDNIKVRQALSYAIDRQEIMDYLADGRGAAVGSSMYPNFEKYFRPELTDYYTFDPDKAKQLLADAGYPDGFDMTITVPSNYQPHMDTAEVVANQLKQIGVNVTIDPVDWGTWLSKVYQGRDYQSTIIGVDAAMMTARAMLERFSSDSASNFTNFSDPEYDEVFRQAVDSTDDTKQVELYGQLQTILTKDAANLYIQDMCDLVAMGNKLQGYEFYPIYVMDLSKVYFTE
ncbi:MAG: ABC transporter substrate-binding protein [Oscillospiraceae bacterium]|nr:ABC transporter substrate-binding protein [Oscillospiraceae bacterium]